MIVKDEEEVLGRVLDDAATFCDEMVVVDTGSSDDTKAVALEHGAEVFDFEWVDDFSAARNFSFEQCSFQWIIWLDADDRIPPPAQTGFLRLKEELVHKPWLVQVMVPYRYEYSPIDPNICRITQWRERVIRAGAGRRWRSAIHENVPVSRARSIRWPEAWVEHRPLPGQWRRKSTRNLQILERLVTNGDRSARTLSYFANELQSHGRRQEALEIYQEYLDTSREAAGPGTTP